MHPIWLAQLDKTRPVLVLTRVEVRAVRQMVTVAPITSTVRGLRSEVIVGQRLGLDHDSVVNLDSIATVPRDALVRPLGALLEEQEFDLTQAFHEAFDLEDACQRGCECPQADRSRDKIGRRARPPERTVTTGRTRCPPGR